MIFEWDGGRFVEFQSIPSTWAYNWHPFADRRPALRRARRPPRPQRALRAGTARGYVAHQELLARCGRAFAHWSATVRQHYLLVAGLEEPPVLLALGRRPVRRRCRPSPGLGARELRVVERHGRPDFVVRVNFILGTPGRPAAGR